MAIYSLGDLVPEIHPEAFVHPDATVIGAVVLGEGSSIWPAAVARGDFGRIEIGRFTSIQDGTVVHATPELSTVIGDQCVIGHNAHLEGCTVGNGCLIGSGAIVLNRCTIEPGAVVAAAALVSEGSTVPGGHVAVGVPARSRPAPHLTERAHFGARGYAEMAARYRRELRRLD